MHVFHKWKYISPGFDYRGCYWTELSSKCGLEHDAVMPAWLWSEIAILKALEGIK